MTAVKVENLSCAKKIKMSSLKSIFLPQWDTSNNPYQSQLAMHLGQLGVEVEGTPPSTIFLLNCFKGGKVDILHLHWISYLILAYGRTRAIKTLLQLTAVVVQLVILRLLGVKIVWTAHNLKHHEDQNQGTDHLCTAWVVKLSHAIITHCESAKHELTAAFPIKNTEKVFVIPHGNYINCYENNIDRTTARKLLGLPEFDLVLLFLGVIRPYKGVLELIETFNQLHQERVQLVIAGKADDQSTELIKQKINGSSHIHFMPGFVADQEIQVFMNACDFAVFPYRDVLTSGGVILAMSFGRACIAPQRGCIGEILDEKGAFLYSLDEEEGLLKAINCAIESKDNSLDMGEHNRKLAEQWNWSHVAKMTHNVYQKCLSE
jgi:glycosyltransferase involved in cell wall biosynthesis